MTASPALTTDLPPEPAPAPVAFRRRLVPALVLAFAAGITAVWAGTAIRASGHGLDLTDEGFYLLSYRWWNADHRTFTGAQYLYGPVFALLGHNIPALRLVRLATILAGHAVFGLAFMRWLRGHRPAAPPTRLWEVAGTAVVVAAGGAVYSWLPQSPGYNDLVLLAALLGFAVVFALARRVDRGVGPGAWLPASIGAPAVAMLLTKWPSVSLLALIAAAGVVALAPAGIGVVLRAAGWVVAGALAAGLLIHLLIEPLTVALPPIITMNRQLTEGSVAVPELLRRYADTTGPSLIVAGRQYGLLMVAAVAAAFLPGRIARIAAGAVGVLGLAWASVFTLRDGGLGGGPVDAPRFVVPLLVVALVTVLAGVAGRAARGRAALLLTALLLAPPVYALGTGNVPLKVTVMAFGMWMAALVAVVTGLAGPVARGLTAAVAAGGLLVVACVATGGLWRHPYRDQPYARAVVPVPGVPALAGVRVTPEQARSYGELRAALTPRLTPPGRRVLGLDKMAGVLLMLDGRTVGEVWYNPLDPARTQAGIRAACAGGPPWTADRAPVLVFNRERTAADARLLRPCGLELDRDYRQLAPPATTGGYTVLVPR